MTEKPGNLALLIDADNVSPKIIVGLLAEIANYGTVSVRRIYGDWTQPNLKGWKNCLLDHSILPIQQFAYTTHKNSTDGAMIIDAMDLLYTNRFSGFCIASSDSDFTRLAARIREQGVTVYGFGERKTTTAFIAACDKFVYFDVLSVPLDEPEEPLVEDRLSSPKSPSASRFGASEPIVLATRPRPSLSSTSKRPLDQAALDGLARAIQSRIGYDGTEYANLADVGLYLSKISPDLNARNYGYNKLKEFVEASGIATLGWKTMSNNPSIALVCLKKSAAEDDEPRNPRLQQTPYLDRNAAKYKSRNSTKLHALMANTPALPFLHDRLSTSEVPLARTTKQSASYLALPIDSDNISPTIVPALLAKCATYGTLCTALIFGDPQRLIKKAGGLVCRSTQ
ncbi:hypothetical protein LTR17_003386 [Elasticomyces elasticus]|nr:hypothetical protein LTR17_003386 [Elasticomyces elasticus]